MVSRELSSAAQLSSAFSEELPAQLSSAQQVFFPAQLAQLREKSWPAQLSSAQLFFSKFATLSLGVNKFFENHTKFVQPSKENTQRRRRTSNVLQQPFVQLFCT